jgi:hypothetical protein
MRLLVIAMVVGAASVAAAQPGMTSPTHPTTSIVEATHASPSRWAVGYQRGTGLGWTGASVGTTISPRVALHLQIFALTEDQARGVSFAPVLELRNYPWMSLTPYLSIGPRYQRMWFGDAGNAGGFGGHATAGLDYRFANGLSIQVGIGLHLREEISVDDGMVTTTQRGMFGPHWDLALRYWFSP